MATNRIGVGVLAACVFTSALLGNATAQTFQDALIQPNTLSAPERASVHGSLAKQEYGPESLAQGTFSLPLPLSFPESRGPLLWGAAPAYQPGAGMSEWGQGWNLGLTINRTRYTGFLDGATDDFVSPWGRLGKGNDGNYYLLGQTEPLRFTYAPATQRWTVTSGDGTIYTFDPYVAAGVSFVSEWYLTEVRAANGYVTRFEYIAGVGRWLLSEIAYAGRGEGPAQLSVTITHAAQIAPGVPIAPIRDFSFGYERVLDQRVATVTVRARHASTGAMTELWTYSLGHAPASFGPAFYLTSVVRSLPGAAGRVSEPAVTYAYDDAGTHLATAGAEPVESAVLAAFFADAPHGGSWIQPRWTAPFDDDVDGITEFENAETYTALRYTGSQWESYQVPRAANADRRCRPDAVIRAASRNLVKLLGPDDATFAVATRFIGDTTEMTVCERSGAVVWNLPVEGMWELSESVRLADVDRDQRPDLLRLSFGTVRLRLNQSVNGQLAFGPEVVQELTPGVRTDAVWFQDVNGDGWGDLIGKVPFGLLVWHGRATGGFVTEAIEMRFRRRHHRCSAAQLGGRAQGRQRRWPR